MPVVQAFLMVSLLLCGETSTGEAAETYRLGPGDIVKVSVWRQDHLERQVSVAPDGTISFPPVGSVHAAGLSSEEIAELIEKKLASFLYNPRVTVTVMEFNSRMVNVLGRVKNPGSIRIIGDFAVLSAVAGAGGTEQDADLRHCSILRGGKELIRVDLYDLFVNGKSELNFPLQINDTIYVPDEADNSVYVLGDVKNPGPMPLRGASRSLLKAISERGGVLDTAYLPECSITRDKSTIINVDLYKLMYEGQRDLDIELKPGDVIFVPGSTNSQVYVVGEIKNPGVYNVTTGQDSIVEMIARAGGYDEDADLSKVKVYRGEMEKPTVMTVALNKMIKGKSGNDFMLEPGDIVYVPTRFLGKVDYVFRKINPGVTSASMGALFYDIIDRVGDRNNEKVNSGTVTSTKVR